MSTTTAPRTDTASPTPLRGPLAVLSVTLGIFAVVTTEILPVGLLTPIGADFAVADGTAGLMMTMPGLLAAVAAPVVTLATARADRRLMLAAFVLLLAVANFLTAAATAYWVVLVARVLVGITIGGFWSIGAGLAGRLVPAPSAARATAVIFAAVPLGSVLGVPAGTLIGDLAGWRTAFVTMGLLSTGVLALLLLTLPALPPERVTRPAVLRALLRRPDTRFALLMTFLVVLAHFGTYTYVTPFLREFADAGPGTITGFLLVYGAAGVAATSSGRPGDAPAAHRLRGRRRHDRRGDGAPARPRPVRSGRAALLVLWGLGYGAVPVCSQTWFTRAAPRTPEAASVLFTASFQATIAAGALAGGSVVDHASLHAVMWLGAATALLVVLAAPVHFVRTRQCPKA